MFTILVDIKNIQIIQTGNDKYCSYEPPEPCFECPDPVVKITDTGNGKSQYPGCNNNRQTGACCKYYRKIKAGYTGDCHGNQNAKKKYTAIRTKSQGKYYTQYKGVIITFPAVVTYPFSDTGESRKTYFDNIQQENTNDDQEKTYQTLSPALEYLCNMEAAYPEIQEQSQDCITKCPACCIKQST